jgi:hypothetical protein
VLRGRFERADEKRYVHMPFEVPRRLRQLHLRYAYSERIDSDPTLVGGNTVDIGIFDERGTTSSGAGFRGWSGSNKLEFTIDERWSTPPYRSGPIGPGRWHLLLGPYKIAPGGCDWLVEIWFDPGVPSPGRMVTAVRMRDRDPLPEARPGWLRGDLHCHSLYSDGDAWPVEMLHAAAGAQLDFLGVTDHNGVAHQTAYGPGGDGMPIVIPGVEVTTYGGHWNAHGTDRWWEFREPSSRAVELEMRAAAASGALVSVCHPKPLGPAWEYAAAGYHAVEVWNGPWARLNDAALAFWDGHLRRGQRIVALGGSDTHRLRTPDPDPRHAAALGMPTTWVDAGERPDAGAIVAALREGRSFISASPRGPQIYLGPHPARKGCVHAEIRGASGATLVLRSGSGEIARALVTADAWDGSFDTPADARYVRAEVVGGSGSMLALSNPVWADQL